MILKTRRSSLLFVLIVALMIVLQRNTIAQSEIPQSIKEMLQNGINILDSAKTPKDVESAVDVFRNAAKLEPKSPEVHYYLGKTLQLLYGNVRNAINQYRKYLELAPDAVDREGVEKEIVDLEKYISVNSDSWLLGFRFMTLHDNVFVWKIREAATLSSDNIKSSLYPGDKILTIGGAEVHKSNINGILQSVIASTTNSIKITVLRGTEQLSMDVQKRNIEDKPPFEYIGESDLKEKIATAKIPLVVYWMKERDIVCLQYEKLLTIVSMRNQGKFSVIAIEMDINKVLPDEYGISYEKAPAAIVYENGKPTLSVAGRGEISKLSEKLKELMK